MNKNFKRKNDSMNNFQKSNKNKRKITTNQILNSLKKISSFSSIYSSGYYPFIIEDGGKHNNVYLTKI